LPRIELWTTVFGGVAGGLAGVLWSGFVTTPWLARGTTPADTQHRETVARMLAASALRAGAGAALGFLFWLGWGLIALVSMPWYGIGSLYGALCWTALIVPALATLALRWPGTGRVAAVHGVEWLFTCLAIGLLCAFAWHRYA
jgi:hypothetical protein